MLENSCCKNLFEKCANNTKKTEAILNARKALIDFDIAIMQSVLLNAKNPDENARKKAYAQNKPLFEEAKKAVKTLNQLCANERITYVFRGKPDDAKAVYEFAHSITSEILDDMNKNMLKTQPET